MDAKHISNPGNDFKKHGVYYGNLPENRFSSVSDYVFGYVEIGKVGFIAFIKQLK